MQGLNVFLLDITRSSPFPNGIYKGSQFLFGGSFTLVCKQNPRYVVMQMDEMSRERLNIGLAKPI